MEPSSSGERRGRGTRPGVRQQAPTNGPPPRPRRPHRLRTSLCGYSRLRTEYARRKDCVNTQHKTPSTCRMLTECSKAETITQNHHVASSESNPCSMVAANASHSPGPATPPPYRRHPRIDATPVSVVPGRRTTGPHTAPLLHSTPLSLQMPAHDIPVDSSRAGRRSHRRVAFKRADRRGPTGHQCWRRGLAPRCRARWSHSLCRCIRFGARGRGRGDGVSPHNTSRRTVRLSSSTCR